MENNLMETMIGQTYRFNGWLHVAKEDKGPGTGSLDEETEVLDNGWAWTVVQIRKAAKGIGYNLQLYCPMLKLTYWTTTSLYLSGFVEKTFTDKNGKEHNNDSLYFRTRNHGKGNKGKNGRTVEFRNRTFIEEALRAA